MTVHPLTSKENPLLKRIRLVASGARRAPQGLVIAEGIRILEEVNRAGCTIEAVVIADDFGSAPREKDLCQRWEAMNISVFRVNGSLFQSVSTVQTPQGAMALVDIPERDLESISPAPNAMILYACGIQDPGNLGTLIRTAAAAGAALVCTSQGTVSARNPKVIRSSAGSFFRVPVVEHTEISELKRFCKLHGMPLYRTHVSGGRSYTEVDLRLGCALLLGNEGAGIDTKAFRSIPAIRIPMAEGVESLNVAVAGAIILFEGARQRQRILPDPNSP